MTRQEVVAIAESSGWRVWGRLRAYGGSKYQCFRRGKDYIWIGNRFVERTGRSAAVDFVSDQQSEVKALIA